MRRSVRARSRRCSAVLSAESSSTNTASQSTPASSRSSRSIRGPTLSRSLSVGTTIVSSGPPFDGIPGDVADSASFRSRPRIAEELAGKLIQHPTMVRRRTASSRVAEMPWQRGPAMTRTATHPSIATDTILAVGTRPRRRYPRGWASAPRASEKWCAGIFCLICTTKIVLCCG
jgi:hypothetical protein